jgi:hypothetical protein
MSMSIDTTHPGYLIAIDIDKTRHDVLVKHPSGARQHILGHRSPPRAAASQPEEPLPYIYGIRFL